MTFSTIDIGTNTILMVTAAVGTDGSVRILGDEHEIARLGKGVDASRTILPETFDRVAGYLLRYREIARGLGAEKIVAFGTSALRDARNREEFVAAMLERTGIRIELLSGEEEAELTFRGALFGLRVDSETLGVLDIGGGSTEIAVGTRERPDRSTSIDIGAVRVAERFFPALPPAPEQVREARAFVRGELEQSFDLPAGTTVVGVAGTITTLGAMQLGLPRFDAEELNGIRLTAASIAATTERLATLGLEETAAIPQISAGRADVILGGAIILDEFMRRFVLRDLIVSTRGVRYGVMMREGSGVKGKG